MDSTDRLIDAINAELDIPFLSESAERVCIEWAARKVCSLLPESLVVILTDAADGLSTEECERLKDVIVALVADRVDIPLVPSGTERMLIGLVVEALLSYAVTGEAA